MNVPRLALVISLLHCSWGFTISSLTQTQTIKTEASQRRRWINDNVWLVEPSITRHNPFVALVPAMGRGCDVSVTWSDPHEGALALAEKCFPFPNTSERRSDAVQLIEEAMEHFRRLIIVEEGVVNASFKARIVASRGSSGIKCPRWHYDHVVLRHIQALVGPGCDYLVSDLGVNRSIVNQADESETKEVNAGIVDPLLASVCHGREGEAVVLRGALGCSRPAIHKSPDLQWWQGRVLMTFDIESSQFQDAR